MALFSDADASAICQRLFFYAHAAPLLHVDAGTGRHLLSPCYAAVFVFDFQIRLDISSADYTLRQANDGAALNSATRDEQHTEALSTSC